MDQANSLREIINKATEKSKKVARIITVSSGKGGVGKSNVSVNLAIQLRKAGKKVVIFDADFGFANIEIIFGIVPRYNIFDIINKGMPIEKVLATGPLGIEVLSGGSGVNEFLKLNSSEVEYLLEKLDELNKYADIIIIDTGAGISEAVLSFICASNEILLVTTPEPTSLTDAYALLKAINSKDVGNVKNNISLIVNRVTNDKEGLEIYNKLNRVAEKFLGLNVTNTGFLPEDKMVKQAVIKQKPVSMIYPNASISKAFIEIGNNVINNEKYDESKKKGLGKIISAFIRRK